MNEKKELKEKTDLAVIGSADIIGSGIFTLNGEEIPMIRYGRMHQTTSDLIKQGKLQEWQRWPGKLCLLQHPELDALLILRSKI